MSGRLIVPGNFIWILVNFLWLTLGLWVAISLAGGMVLAYTLLSIWDYLKERRAGPKAARPERSNG